MAGKIANVQAVTPIQTADSVSDWYSGEKVETSKVNPTRSNTDSPYYQDSLGASQTQANAKKVLPQHPVLAAPSQLETTATPDLTTEITRLISQVKGNPNAPDGNAHFSDTEFLPLFLIYLEKQRKIRAESGKMAQDNFFTERKVKKALHEKSYEVEDKALAAAKVSKVAGWVSYALSGSFIATVLGSLIYGAVTGNIKGAGGRILKAVQGGLLVSEGATSAVKGYSDYKEGQHSGELVGIREHRDESHEKIKTHMKESKDALKSINYYMELRAQIQRNWQEASHIQI